MNQPEIHDGLLAHREPAHLIEFSSFDLGPSLLKGISQIGFLSPSLIQQKAIPMVLAGKDLIGRAQTGSGKTAAFAIPAIQNMRFDGTVEVLVLVPTRELCKQVVVEFERLGRFAGVKVVGIVGGESSFRQIELVNKGAQIVVATPGRLLDHLSSGSLKRFAPRMLVLDEADEMLNMGFIDDIREILTHLPKERQTLLFSATMPEAIAKLAKQELKDPEHIHLASKEESHNDIEQALYVIRHTERQIALLRLLEAENPSSAVVFCRTRRDTVDVCDMLTDAGISARPLHGDMSQNDRTKTVADFKNGKATVLVATDVASRGLDIPQLTHVFNYHVPENEERYTHRIGRTGRAGKKGKSLTMVTPQDLQENPYFWASLKDSRIEFCEVPAKSDLQKKNDTVFFAQISQIEVSDDIRKACAEFVTESNAQEIVEKLYTFIRGKTEVRGPDRIGMSLPAFKELQAFSGSRFSRPGGRSSSSFRSGGGSYSRRTNFSSAGRRPAARAGRRPQ